MFCIVTLISYSVNGQWCGLGLLLKQIYSKSYKFVLVSVPIWYHCPSKGQEISRLSGCLWTFMNHVF